MRLPQTLASNIIQDLSTWDLVHPPKHMGFSLPFMTLLYMTIFLMNRMTTTLRRWTCLSWIHPRLLMLMHKRNKHFKTLMITLKTQLMNIQIKPNETRIKRHMILTQESWSNISMRTALKRIIKRTMNTTGVKWGWEVGSRAGAYIGVNITTLTMAI